MSVVSSALHVNSMQNLHEEDVPGAFLAGRDPKMLKVVELQHWLQCRGASTKRKRLTYCYGKSS